MLKSDELIDDESLYLDNGLDSTVAMQKKPPLFPNIEGIIESLRKDFIIPTDADHIMLYAVKKRTSFAFVKRLVSLQIMLQPQISISSGI